MNIYLLRHGETEWTKKGCLQGHTNIPLSEEGRIQIADIAEKLSDSHIGIDLILSSPLIRAKESAEIVAARFLYEKEKILIEPRLIERAFGLGEGLTSAERKEKYPDFDYPEMEPFSDLMQRAKSVFYKIVDSYKNSKNILVVAHGAILYAIITAITDGKIEYFGEKVKLNPGSIHRIKCEEEKIEVAAYDFNRLEFVDIDINS